LKNRSANLLTKEQLYESVKQLIELETSPEQIIHLSQQKLYTLFTIAFEYLLYMSTKKPGAYIIRIEDAHLADKLAFKAKDQTTKKFMSRMLLPRRLKYNSSVFYLDFFSFTTWQQTNEIPHHKIKGALIVKNTTEKVLADEMIPDDDQETTDIQLPDNYYLESLRPIADRVIVVAYNKEFDNAVQVKFPFISEKEAIPPGVIIKEDLKFDDDL
jgi:hypothetical protein